jgi:hypothetical protein
MTKARFSVAAEFLLFANMYRPTVWDVESFPN